MSIVYQNYHKHSWYTNTKIADSTVSYSDYAKRAVELGHSILSSCEHGYQGRYYEVYKTAKENGLKPLIAGECYWVKDRTLQDRTNCHIFIGAKNENGRQALNDVLSEANLTGFYFQPRLDIPLILSLPKNDIIVTSACVAGWRYEDADSIMLQFAEHFQKNFFLEVQYHNTEAQRTLNERILKLHNEYKIPLIMGCDSHFIYPSQAQERDDFLLSKGLHYEDEEGWQLDYPSGDEAYDRFANQTVLSHTEIMDAIDNTNVFLDVEDYDTEIFNDEIKLPSLYPNLTQEEKDEKYKALVWKGWDDYKKTIPEEKHPVYEEEIKKEIQTVVDTHMADYFMIDYEVMKKGRENGGWLTKSGRGCFTRDALIVTSNGIKHLNEVKVGDMVFDLHGDLKKVTNTMSYDIEEPLVQLIYSYSNASISPMICTLDHRILVRNKNGEIIWKEAQYLENGDYLCSPRFRLKDNEERLIDLSKYNSFGYEVDDRFIYEKNPYRNKKAKYSPTNCAKHIGCSKSVIENIANGKRKLGAKNKEIIRKLLEFTGYNSIEEYCEYIKAERTIKINRFIPNDYITNLWIGMMYGDGTVPRDRIEISLALNKGTHKNKINRIIFEIMAQRFGVGVREGVAKNRQLVSLYMNSNIVSSFSRARLFTSEKGKEKQFNFELLNQNITNQKGILSGLNLTDGSFCEKTRISFDNTSKSILSAYCILSKSVKNDPLSIGMRKSWLDKRGYNCKTSFKVRTYSASEFAFKKKERTIKNNEYVFIPVDKIKILPKQKTTVYDITVEDSHSYVLNNIVVHNSGASFFTNTLLGFSDTDRVSADVHMYPERFMSTTRLLQSKGIPDIDMDEAPTEPFVRAQAEILGQDHSYPMLSYGTMKTSAAWKLYAKAQGIPFEVANAISEDIKRYEKALKHADEDEIDEIKIEKYINKDYLNIFDASKAYLGLIASWSIAPCSSLIYNKNIRKEIGLVRIKENLCCLMDGKWAEECHFLKNDHLKVSVVELIYKTCAAIGIEPPAVKKLLAMCPPNDDAWKIYERGCCLGINQVEKEGTQARVMKYKPHNIAELTAFVAAIRPGFSSLYKKFENREHYSFGIKSLDDVLQTPEMRESWLLYQESIMAVLNYAGIPMEDCYTAIKNIAKKRVEKVLALQSRFREGMTKRLTDEGYGEDKIHETCDTVWKTIEDAASYSYNASHAYCVALNSLYCAWLKAHHPLQFYETYIAIQEAKGDKDKIQLAKAEAEEYFGIKFAPLRFRQDNRTLHIDEENNQFINSMSTIKGYGASVGRIFYECGKHEFRTFLDLLAWLDNAKIKEAKFKPLIQIDYFSEFGSQSELLEIAKVWDFFKQGTCKNIKKTLVSEARLQAIINRFASSKNKNGSESMSYSFENEQKVWECMYECEKQIIEAKIPEIDFKTKIKNSFEILGYVNIVTGKDEDRRRLLITDLAPLKDKNTGKTWAYRAGTRSLGSGKTARVSVTPGLYENNPFTEGDIIYAHDLYKNKAGFWYLTNYEKI